MLTYNILTDVKIKKATPREKKYYLNDGLGLRLKITPDNSKIWCFRFKLNNKSFETTFKSYPLVSLSEAREKRDIYRKLLNDRINPIEYFRNLKEKELLEDKSNIQNVFNEWLESEKIKSNELQWNWKKTRIQKDIINQLGKNKNIQNIKIDDIKKVLVKKSQTAPNTADKLFTYVKGIFSYAKANQYLENNILSDINKSHIIGVVVPQAINYPKITNIEIFKELINKIYNYQGHYSTTNALKLILHLPFRASNLCNLKWEYIDFENNTITIPRNIMKVKNKNLDDFTLPLTKETIKILKNQKKLTYHQQWVFLGNGNKNPIDVESPNKALRIMGFDDIENNRKITLHGFRGTFRSLIDTLDVDNKFSFEAKEYVLDHQEKSKVVRAYTNKANYIKQLIPLMDFWSDYILSLKD